MQNFLFKLVALLSFVFSFTSALAQYPISPNALDENGLRTGYWTIWYDSAFKEIKNKDSVRYYRLARYDAGKPIGKVRDFFRSGTKQWDGYLTAINPDFREGDANWYFENGQLREALTYKQNKANGPYKEFTVNGKLKTVATYKNDSTEGRYIAYYEDGTVQLDLMMKVSVVNGYAKSYYPNGKVQVNGFKKNGNTDGPWDEYYDNGQLKSHIEFKNGLSDGVYELYDEQGTIKEKGQHRNDIESGTWSYYHPNGKVKAVGEKDKEGNGTGLWTYYSEEGELSEESMRVGGKFFGLSTRYFPNKKLKGKGLLDDNRFQGDWVFYYENGQVSRMGKYVLDSLDGQWNYFHENGKLSSEGAYVNHKKNGHWKYYDEKGNLQDEENLVVGQLEGIAISYFSNGQINEQKKYIQGKLDGDFIGYYENGKIKVKKSYKLGQLDGWIEEFHENGALKVKGRSTLDKREGEWVWYFANGKIDGRQLHKDGKFDGAWANYYENGNVLSEGTASNGSTDGFTKYYYPDGKLKKQGLFVKSNYEGPWVFYDSISGKKSHEGNYIHDNRHGKWNFYHPSIKKLQSTGNYVHGKLDGKWLFYDSLGKKEKPSYYIKGFWETVTNVRDSIYRIMDAGEGEKAWQAVDWLQKVIDREAPKNSWKQELPSYFRGRISYFLDNNQDALNHYQQNAIIVKSIEGDSSANYTVALNGVALALKSLGRNEESIKKYDEVLEITKKYEGVDSDDYEIFISNKAIALMSAGKTTEAENLFLNEIHRREEVFGIGNKKTWYSLWWLGNLYQENINENKKSIEIYKKLITAMAVAKDSTDSYNITARSKLGQAYKNINERKEGIKWMKQALALEEAAGVKNITNYVTDGTTLSHLYLGINQVDSANDITNKLLHLLTQRNQTQSINFANTINQKAQVYYHNSSNIEAAATWQQALDLLESLGWKETSKYGSILFNTALSIYASDKSKAELAEKYYLESLGICKKLDGMKSYNYRSRLADIGNFYTKTSRYKQAQEYLLEAKQIILTMEGDSTETYAACLEFLALNYMEQGDYKNAMIDLEQAAIIARAGQQNDPSGCARILSNLSDSYKKLEEYEKAEAAAREAIQVIKNNLGEHHSYFIDYNSELADLFIYRGLYSDAEKIHLSNLKKTRELFGENSMDYGHAVRSVGYVYKEMGQYKKAQEYYQSYQNIALKLKGETSYDYYRAASNLAQINFQLGLNEQAETLYKKSLLASEKIYGKTNMDYAWDLKSVANFYAQTNRFSLAEKYLKEGMAICASTFGKEHQSYAGFMKELANAYVSLDRNKEAEELLQQAVAIYKKFSGEVSWNYINGLEPLTNFYQNFGRYKESEALYKKRLELIEKLDGKKFSYAKCLDNLANTYRLWEKYDQAKEAIEKSLVIYEDEVTPDNYNMLSAKNLLGIICLKQLKFDEAEVNFKYCIDQSERNKKTDNNIYSSAYHNLGLAMLEKGNFAEAEKNLLKASALEKSWGIDVQKVSYRQEAFAKLYQAWGKPELAETYWQATTKLSLDKVNSNFFFLSDNEKAQFWNTVRSSFEYFNTFAVQRSKQNPSILGAMYNNQLATKAILLSTSNKIKKRILGSNDSTMIADYTHWVEARNELAQYYSMSEAELKAKHIKLDSMENVAKKIEKDLNITADDLAKDNGNTNVTWKEVQKILSPNEAAIEIIRFRVWNRHQTDSVVYAALILTSETKTAPQLVVLPNGNYLETKANRFYKNAITAQIEDTRSYQSYWAAIEPLVKNKSRIYLSLDGVFNQINLNTLKNAEGNYLVEQKNFTIVSNTKDLLFIKGKKSSAIARATATLLGYPKYFLGPAQIKKKMSQRRDFDASTMDAVDATGIAELPGTKTEIEKINEILVGNKWQVENYMEEEASEDVLKAIHNPKVLHIATHGYFVDDESGDKQDPMLRAGLLLTGASNFIQNKIKTSNENGILTAYEAANLNLENTDLVVLSACETGKGEVQNGEGVYGLQRAFQTAGAKSIAMSLWKVDDNATQQLMTLFYQNWVSGKSKSEAFKQAQIGLKNKFPHPYYWGAFVMMGE